MFWSDWTHNGTPLTLFSIYTHFNTFSGVRDREVERRPHNHQVLSLIPGSGCQLWDLHWPHIRREYSYSSQEAESRKIRISCMNLFLNRCKINIFKLTQ